MQKYGSAASAVEAALAAEAAAPAAAGGASPAAEAAAISESAGPVAAAEAASLGADVLFGTGDRQGFVRAVETAAAERGAGESVTKLDDPFRRTGFEELPAGAYAGHARAYLKIQDGCDNFCTYCIIPFARGRVLSLPEDRCAAEAASLAAQGYKESVARASISARSSRRS